MTRKSTTRLPTIPANFPVKEIRTDRQKAQASELATCGECGRSWDDGIATGWTPAPAGRCPFEYYHATEA